MELLNLLLFSLLRQRNETTKTKTGYFAIRKAQRLEMKRKRNEQYNKYAQLMIDLNELHELRHCKPLFDTDLKKIRFCFGDRVTDRIIDRIESVKNTTFDEMTE